MALKDLYKMSAKENETYLIGIIDNYLYSKNEENDRAFNVNSPSQIGKCMRCNYYIRVGMKESSSMVNPRLQRIFDNGSSMHLRMQHYLKDIGVLLIDELPVYNLSYEIQGHTDGLLRFPGKHEFFILELKSINSRSFSSLKAPKKEHVMQTLIYIFCIEQHRQWLLKNMDNFTSLKFSRNKAVRYSNLYKHLVDGSKYTAKEKVDYQVGLHCELDKYLCNDLETPVTKGIILYENKDTQELKEFLVDSSLPENKQMLKECLEYCTKMNEYVKAKELPARESNNKNDSECRFCPYRIECWN